MSVSKVICGGVSLTNTVTLFSTDTALGTSDSVVPTQKAVKAYVDANTGGGGGSVTTASATSALYYSSDMGSVLTSQNVYAVKASTSTHAMVTIGIAQSISVTNKTGTGYLKTVDNFVGSALGTSYNPAGDTRRVIYITINGATTWTPALAFVNTSGTIQIYKDTAGNTFTGGETVSLANWSLTYLTA